jgi:curved DNA-binding protein
MEGSVMLTIPAGTQSGQLIRLKRLGMPASGTADRRGDLYARIGITLPRDISQRERDLFEQLQQISQDAG